MITAHPTWYFEERILADVLFGAARILSRSIIGLPFSITVV
jgi:hypothetical protein